MSRWQGTDEAGGVGGRLRVESFTTVKRRQLSSWGRSDVGQERIGIVGEVWELLMAWGAEGSHVDGGSLARKGRRHGIEEDVCDDDDDDVVVVVVVDVMYIQDVLHQ